MKIYAITIFNWSDKEKSLVLSQARDLSSFGYFRQGTVKEFLMFISREAITRTHPGEIQTITHQVQEGEPDTQFQIHSTVRPDHFGGVIISDKEYEPRIAHHLLQKCISLVEEKFGKDILKKYNKDVFLDVPEIQTLLGKYQQPDEVDKIAKIDKDLKETKAILLKTIDQLLIRGEKLEELAKKSSDLSDTSKVFLDRSKKLNPWCCVIL